MLATCLIVLIPAGALAATLGVAALLLGLDAPLLRCEGRPRLLADLRFDQRLPHHRLEAIERLAAVLLLAALAARRYQDAAVVNGLLSGDAAQPLPRCRRQRAVRAEQKAQLHGAGYLVDVLAAGSWRADELPFQLVVADGDLWCDDQRHRIVSIVVTGAGVHVNLALRHRNRQAVLPEQPPDLAVHVGTHVIDALLRIGDP